MVPQKTTVTPHIQRESVGLSQRSLLDREKDAAASEAWQRYGEVEGRWSVVVSAGVSEAGRPLLDPMPGLRRTSEVGSIQILIGGEKELPAILT